MTRRNWIPCGLAAALAVAPALAQQPTPSPAPEQQPPAQQQPAPPPAPSPAAQPAPAPAPAPAAAVDRLYVDEDYDFRVAAPAGWARTNPAGIAVPGESIRAWSPDGTAWIVIFRQVPKGPVSPTAMTTNSADALRNSLGAEVAVQEVRDLSGMRAMWLIANGKGTGSALDGKGAVATSQHWVALPREDDVLIFLHTAPTEAFAQTDRVFTDMIRTLQAGGSQTAAQRGAQ
jgi:hypothetical protein